MNLAPGTVAFMLALASGLEVGICLGWMSLLPDISMADSWYPGHCA